MSLLYLDSSALVKLIAPEPETEALLGMFDSSAEGATSALATVEVMRAVRRARLGARALERARSVLASVARVAVDAPILESAAALAPRRLRSLDAVHLATALALREELSWLVSYDRRLSEAAELAGLPAIAPI